MRKYFCLAALSLATLPLAAMADDESTPSISIIGAQTDAESNATYWLRKREGWFWYRDPPQILPPPKESPASPIRPPELVGFEAMQKRLDDLKRVAVMNPSDANLLAYMRYQRFVMNKSELFAQNWQRLVWTVPDLDYGLTGRPTNSMAVAAFDEQQRERQAQTVRNLAATQGLLFIFRSDCPY